MNPYLGNLVKEKIRGNKWIVDEVERWTQETIMSGQGRIKKVGWEGGKIWEVARVMPGSGKFGSWRRGLGSPRQRLSFMAAGEKGREGRENRVKPCQTKDDVVEVTFNLPASDGVTRC